MKVFKIRLIHHLMIAVMLKLVVLAVLWLVFVRDARVTVTTELAADRMVSIPVASGVSK